MTMDQISSFIIEVAEQEILPRFGNLVQGDITAKSPGDMVSVADIEAEKSLSEKLGKLCPGALIAGEETIADNPGLLIAAISADRAFLIDPVDGTNNFIKGDERFALMLTEMRKGEVVAGWIYLPVSQKLAVAEKSAGAMLNGEKAILPPPKPDYASLTGAAHINRFPENLRVIAGENLKKFKENRPAFCAGHDYISLLEGRKDFSVYYRTLPWDHLPGSLIFAEAGGYVRTLFDGAAYTVHDQEKGLLSARNKEQWHKIREMIFPDGF
ncbi:MAG: inositol monophosphatase [Alphaproteobacteria bacterium]|nr:inositol monophosphatase [Alphaproteobacteria bacterium]